MIDSPPSKDGLLEHGVVLKQQAHSTASLARCRTKEDPWVRYPRYSYRRINLNQAFLNDLAIIKCHLRPVSTNCSYNFCRKSGLRASGSERIPRLSAVPVENTVVMCSVVALL